MEPLPVFPPEIWLMILDYVPASFFQQDLGRLTVCKHFYSLAYPVFFKHVECTARVLSRLVNRKSNAVKKARDSMQEKAQSITIVLDGMGEDWSVNYNTYSNLVVFGFMLKDFVELKTLRFVAGWPNRSWRADPYQPDYLPLDSVKPFLENLSHITTLDLDLRGTNISKIRGVRTHFCPFIRPLLSKLHTLDLRARCMCGEALTPIEGQPVSVRRISVNLDLGEVSKTNPKLNSTRLCNTPDVSKWGQWRCPAKVLCRGFVKLKKEMPKPGYAQLIHLTEGGEVHTWNASTETCAPYSADKSRLSLEPEKGGVTRCYTTEF